MRAYLFVLLAACGTSSEPPKEALRTEVARISSPSSKLDLLFVIDESPGTLDYQNTLKSNFPSFLDELRGITGTLPSLHLGVIGVDLGTNGFEDAAPGPPLGSGPGSCSGTGKGGRLQTNGSTLVTGSYLTDTNYTGSLETAFASIATIGSSGCGIEQPLESMRLALADASGPNAGFIRDDARLAIVMLHDEDDCSFAHSALLGPDDGVLGPLQSFRCTRFGVQCDVGGETPEDMAVVGPKSGCHSRPDSPYMPTTERYRDFLTSFKATPDDVLLAVIAGPPRVSVEVRSPPGGGTAISALAHSCRSIGSDNSTQVADPAVRLHELTADLPRGEFAPICTSDYGPTLHAIGRNIRTLLGDTCLPSPLPQGADCAVTDELGATQTPLDACSESITTDCYAFVEDSACTAGGHLRLAITRSTPAPEGTVTSVACRLAPPS